MRSESVAVSLIILWYSLVIDFSPTIEVLFMLDPNRKLTKQETAQFFNEARLRLSLIATTNINIDSIIVSCEKALSQAEYLQQTYLAGYVHEPVFMGVQIPLVWDVTNLLKSSSPVATKEVSVQYLRNLMVPEMFDDPYGTSYSCGPIILAELPFCFPNACILDGNHRVLDALRSGNGTLPAKLYYAQDHIGFMSPYSKVLFSVCCNILYASLLVEGKISAEEFKRISFPLD